MPIINRIAEFHREMTEWRHDLHAHPELALQETRTSGVVQEKLKSFGVDEIITGMARTGVVGVIRGRGDGTRAIGLRADMDALPILEESGVDYASQNQGVMHACGHDGHTTMLLGAAKYLAETRNFDGTVNFIAFYQKQRSALCLADGNIYFMFASWGADSPPYPNYHGWLLGYSATTLQLSAVFNDTPNGDGGGLNGGVLN